MNRHRRSWHSKEMHSEETFIMDQQNQGRRGYIHCWGLLLLRSRAPEAGQCHVFVYFLSLGMSDSIYVCLLNKLCISMYSYSFLPHVIPTYPSQLDFPQERDLSLEEIWYTLNTVFHTWSHCYIDSRSPPNIYRILSLEKKESVCLTITLSD